MKEGMSTPPTDQPAVDETEESRRFRKLDGIDYKRGAIDYPQKLAPSDRHHLLTKPFYNLAHRHSEKYEGEGPDADTHRHFSDFANMAVALALPAGARILDVGCGAGWLCEYFARFGYHVTGVDISPTLIELARERLQRVPYRVDEETNLNYQFFVHDIEIAALPETFDAVICYDALHHFEDEDAVFANLRAMLNYGGLLFVLEGERPPAGSASAEELRGVMRQYQTLESPFSREYLLTLLRTHGFTVVGDYLGISGLFEREAFAAERIMQEQAGFNYLLCKKVAAVGPASMPNTRAPGKLRADINLEQELPRVIGRAARLEFYLIVKNTGDTLWLIDRYAPPGTVRLATKLFDETNNLLEEVHGVPALPRAVAPGEQVRLKVTRTAPAMTGTYTLKIDLIDQDICWFEERGSEPLAVTFAVANDS
ncbi:MAG: hypothetical protein QOE77_1536 [Blastocatellia bacterium]|jgi:2-polyprenyl-3-methyl-5-hydroxy-6-metoxy-1,4-benzoquinol methylase|nr:hypothetical protein [Blastocatellia bacterium]